MHVQQSSQLSNSLLSSDSVLSSASKSISLSCIPSIRPSNDNVRSSQVPQPSQKRRRSETPNIPSRNSTPDIAGIPPNKLGKTSYVRAPKALPTPRTDDETSPSKKKTRATPMFGMIERLDGFLDKIKETIALVEKIVYRF
jgi:hypothetical protein